MRTPQFWGRSADQSRVAITETEAAPERPAQDATAALVDALLANSSEAIITVDDAGTILFASVGASQLLGYDPESTVGASVFSFLQPEAVDAEVDLFIRRMNYEGPDLGHEVLLRHSSGDWIAVTATARLLPDSALGAAAITMKARNAEEQRRQSLHRRLVVEEFCNRLSGDLIDATDSADVLNRLQQSLEEVGLLTGADMVAMYLERHERDVLERLGHWIEPGLADDGQMQTIDIALDREAIETVLTEHCVADSMVDSPLWGDSPITRLMNSVSLLTVPFAAGTQRGVLVLTHVKPGPGWSEADGHLARSVAKLFGRALNTARAEELLALTYEKGPIGFCIRTWSGTFVDCNQQYLDLHGLSREDAEATNLRDLLHPEDWPGLAARREQLHKGEVVRLTHDNRTRRADGTWRWVRANSVRLQASGSSELFVLTSLEDVTENHDQRAELEHTARHDSLTGVANREAMRETMERLVRANHRLPNLLIIDLDRFKLINDSLGHVAGDQVLVAVVERIVEQVRDIDLVARLGGDEFAVIVPDDGPRGVYELAENLRRSMERPLDIEGRVTTQTISIGVAIGADCADVAELLVRADRAMYVAKAKGRNRHVVFDESMRHEALARLAMERELRHAIDHDQLEIYFQPEFAMDDRRIVGAEALLRWKHPVLGLLAATYFIDVAEQSGMIDEIGRFALREACRSFAEITGSADSQLMLRLNISGREFARPELPDLVRAALNESGLAPDRLCLEMTETTLMDSPEVALETFTRLHEIGVQFAIDDFGTGYSSLIYLKRFPVDALKIDRRFVEDIATNGDSRVIVESIISLGGALALEVIAEGIETETQLEILRTLGCERAQGHLVSAPLSAVEFVPFLRAQDGTQHRQD